MNKQQMKTLVLKAYQHDRKNMSYKTLCEKYHKVKMKIGIDVFSLSNKGKDMNRFNINSLGGNSGGGRLGAIQKSIYNVR